VVIGGTAVARLRPALRRFAALVALAVLVVVAPGAAPGAVTDDGAILDIQNETYALDGNRTYTTSASVYNAGTLRVGPSGSLTIRTPQFVLGFNSQLDAIGAGTGGAGGNVTVICEDAVILETASIRADGANGTSASRVGKNGGSITIRASRSIRVRGPVSANGGAGLSDSTARGGNGGNGGAIQFVTPDLMFETGGASPSLATNGGAGGAGLVAFPTGGWGGWGGSIRVDGGNLLRGGQATSTGGKGGDSATTQAGVGGDGGVVRIGEGTVTGGTWTLSAAGGLGGIPAGGGLSLSGTAGTTSERIAVTAPYIASPFFDGYVNDAEYLGAQKWSIPTAGGNASAYVCEDGRNLWVGIKSPTAGGSTNTSVYLCLDLDNDGGTLDSQDLMLLLDSTWSPSEYSGTPGGWAVQTRSGWSGMYRPVGGGSPGWTAEYCISYEKLGLTAGQAKEIGIGLRHVLTSTSCVWPAGLDINSPGTWSDVDSVDLWTARGNVPPGSWTGFTPTGWQATAAPAMSVQVQDSDYGLQAGSQRFKYSTDAGVSWSATMPAAGALGSTAPQTINMSGVTFPQGSANRVRFYAEDVGGLGSWSPDYTVLIDTGPPTPWTGFVPAGVVNDSLTPDCSVQIRDMASGIDTGTAEFSWTKDGGGYWYPWSAATVTGTFGSTAVQTITALSPQFQQNSTTQNMIRFRIADATGKTATSGDYPVQTTAPIDGLPTNGDFELGWAGQVPSRWWVERTSTSSGAPARPTSSVQNEHLGRRYGGNRSAVGSVRLDGLPQNTTCTVEATLRALSRADFTGVDYVYCATQDGWTVSGSNGAFGWTNWTATFSLVFDDGSGASEVVALDWTGSGGSGSTWFDKQFGTDGNQWRRFRVAIPTGLDKRSLRAMPRWNLTVRTPGSVTANNYASASLRADWLHADDGVKPASNAIAATPVWNYDLPAGVGWTASDNAGLGSLSLWSRRRPFGGAWTAFASEGAVSVSGYAASGSSVFADAGEGLYEFYTIARDGAGNEELPPSAPDMSLGIDRSGPSLSAFAPSGWATNLTVTGNTDAADPGSGLSDQLVRTGDGPAADNIVGLESDGAGWVFGGVGSQLTAWNVTDMRGTSAASTLDLVRVRDLALDGRNVCWVVDDGAVRGISKENPAAMELLGTAPGVTTAVTVERAPESAAVIWAGLTTSNRLVSIDARDPWLPAPMGQSDLLSGRPLDLVSGSKYLYALTDAGKLDILESANGAGVVVASVPLSDAPVAMALGEGRAYIACRSGISVVNLPDDPAAAVELSYTPTGLRLTDVSVSGDRLFFSRFNGTIEAWDVSDPLVPTMVDTLVTGGGNAMSLADDAGLHVFADGGTTGLCKAVFTMPAYRYSIDSGVTWSGWLTAAGAVPGSNGPCTLSSDAVTFPTDSGTAYRMQFWAADGLGNATAGPIENVRIDSTAPSAPLVGSPSHSHPTSWYPSHTVEMAWTTPPDTSGIAGYSVKWGDDPLNMLPGTVVNVSASTTWTAITSEGVHYFSVRALDNAGNWSSASPPFPYQTDYTDPGTPTNVGVTPASWSSTETYIVSWTKPTSSPSPLANVKYQVGSMPALPGEGTFLSPDTTRVVVPYTADGTTPVYIEGIDAATNRGGFGIATLYHDGTPPTTPAINSSTHLSDATWYANASPSFSWLGADTVSGIHAYAYSLNNTSTTVLSSASSHGSQTTTSYAGLADGEWWLHVAAVDQAGNASTTAHRRVRIDRAAPAAPDVSSSTHVDPASWYTTGTVRVSWTPPTDGSGVAGYSYEWSDTSITVPAEVLSPAGLTASQPVGADGVHYFHVRAKDNAGNWGATTHFTYQADRNAPASPIGFAASPSTWSNTNQFEYSWTKPPSAAPIDRLWWKYNSPPTGPSDGGQLFEDGTQAWSWIPAGTEMTRTVFIWLGDAAGNADYRTATSTVVYADRVAPEAPIDLRATPSTWTSATTVTLGWTNPVQLFAPLSARRYKFDLPPIFSVDGTRVAGGGPSLTVGAPAADGTHTAYVWLEDQAGNTDKAKLATTTVYIDRTAPAAPANLALSPPGWSDATTRTLQWTNPTDCAPIAGSRYAIGAPPTSDASGTWTPGTGNSVQFRASSVPGTYAVYVWLQDAAGNTNRHNYSSAVVYVRSPSLRVYRLFNTRTGVHFYTGNEAERNYVSTVLGSIYRYEGPAYEAVAGQTGAVPLYRFYHLQRDVHFYTASEAEKDQVLRTLGGSYRYEGVAYWVLPSSTGGKPVYRFYNFRKGGVHFYTASYAEYQNVLNTLGNTYRYEGVGYWVPAD
jgi:hypothetical protein